MRQLFLAATGQNRGKTTACVGLLDGFRRRGYRTGFSKPVGQRTMIIDGEPGDEDAVLMKTIFDLPDPYTAMSPIHIPRGFTKRYLAGDVVEDMEGPILAAQRYFADHDVWLIEGTGHAGVGAVVGLSNARVASMLRAPTVIISEGGVGRPIDEIVLNASHFEAHGVPVAGAIVNKLRVDESAGHREDAGARPRAARDPAPGRAALQAHPVQPHAGHGAAGRQGPGHLPRARPGPA